MPRHWEIALSPNRAALEQAANSNDRATDVLSKSFDYCSFACCMVWAYSKRSSNCKLWSTMLLKNFFDVPFCLGLTLLLPFWKQTNYQTTTNNSWTTPIVVCGSKRAIMSPLIAWVLATLVKVSAPRTLRYDKEEGHWNSTRQDVVSELGPNYNTPLQYISKYC